MRASCRPLALAVTGLLLASACRASPSGLEKRLQDAVNGARRAPGASVAILTDGKVTWTGTSGVADLTSTASLGARTRFPVASTTKNFVAALALKLAEDGALSLDDPISKWFPLFLRAGRITLRRLLSHTAGLRPHVAAERHDPGKPWTITDLLPSVERPVCDVGRCGAYSDENFIGAGLVIEAAMGKKLEDLLRARLFEPLGLQDTSLVTADVVSGDVVQEYGEQEEPIGERGTSPLKNTWAAGSMFSTPTDLARWISALFAGRLLKVQSLQQMLDVSLTKSLPCPPETECTGRYGLGIERVVYASRETWGHEGSSGSMLRYIPEKHMAIAILQNQIPTATAGPRQIFEAVLRALGIEERADVYTVHADGTGLTRLTEAPAVDGTPVPWSADGSRILFGSGRDGNQEVYVMRSDGSDERNLTNDPARDVGGSWVRDGRIVFSSDRSGQSILYVIDADGSNLKELPDTRAGDRLPFVSPDGKRVAFATGAENEYDLVVMRMDGSERHVVASGPGMQWWPSWSPDSKQIVFADQSDAGFRIAVVDADGSHRRTLLVMDARQPAWSPDGRFIAFVRGGEDVVIVSPDGSAPRVLAHDPIAAYGPTWSPDGARLAFVSSRS